MMKVRPATREDIKQFSGFSFPNTPTIKAWVGEVDGKVEGISGFALSHGRWYIFCDLNEKAKPYKMTIAKNAHRVMKEAREMGIRYIYAQIDEDEPRAIAWLGTLGFEPDPRSSLYRWRS